MSHQDRSADAQKGTSVRALQFTPPKAKDGSLITSSVRKKKRGGLLPLSLRVVFTYLSSPTALARTYAL